MPTMSKISPCLWFNGEAEAAAKHYTKIFPDSRILSVDRSRRIRRAARRAWSSP
jgi:predicted 3-demethylubiquinone-9 3-methyltransferase (glyoxalase superfamily)